MKLLALLVSLAALIHGHATVAGAAVDVRATVLIAVLAVCAGLGLAAARRVFSFRSSPCVRWSHA